MNTPSGAQKARDTLLKNNPNHFSDLAKKRKSIGGFRTMSPEKLQEISKKGVEAKKRLRNV